MQTDQGRMKVPTTSRNKLEMKLSLVKNEKSNTQTFFKRKTGDLGRRIRAGCAGLDKRES